MLAATNVLQWYKCTLVYSATVQYRISKTNGIKYVRRKEKKGPFPLLRARLRYVTVQFTKPKLQLKTFYQAILILS